MELLDGDDLLTVIEDASPLAPVFVVSVMRQVLSALAEAHHVGIIHRDLKPENVIVIRQRGGEVLVKVCDFGIAKIQDQEGGSAITVSGFVCGTPEYMAPE
jgi:serine/threonine-protein kinase